MTTCVLPFDQSFLTSRPAIAGAAAVSLGSIAYYTHLYGTLPFVPEASANSAADDGLHPAAYPWPHKGPFETYDHASYVSPKRAARPVFLPD